MSGPLLVFTLVSFASSILCCTKTQYVLKSKDKFIAKFGTLNSEES